MASEKPNGGDPDYRGVAALGIVSRLASLFPPKTAFEAVAKPMTGKEKIEWKANFCSGCHQPTCATQVKVVDGVVVEVAGDKKSETNQGALCPRGLSLPMNQYNPYRVKTPLMRTNPKKGFDEDPGWVEISWEEALATVGGKLKEARATDPRSILYF